MSDSDLYSIEYRTRVNDRVLEIAHADGRVVAGAVIGSLALEEGDRWSDLDLTFGVRSGVDIRVVLEDFTRILAREFEAVVLFDLPAGPSIYRVFLLPGCLQCDLSFTPEAEFAARGPKFRLLFGRAVDRPWPGPPNPGELLGYAVHHALRARFCIERGRYWQAEYWISSLRDNVLSLASRRRKLPAHYGRGFDDLPDDVREKARGALVGSLERAELLRALSAAIDLILPESEEAVDLAWKVEGQLRLLQRSAADA